MKRNLAIYRQILTLLREYPRTVILLFSTSFFGVFTEGLGLGLILPLLQPDLTGSFLAQIPQLAPVAPWLQSLTLIERVRLAALFLLSIVFIRNLLVVATRFAALKLQEQIEYDLKLSTFRQLHTLELRYIYRQQMGGMFTTLTQYTWQATWMMNYVTGAVTDGFALIVYTGLMFLVSWQLTIVAAGVLLMILLLNNHLFLGRLHQLGWSEANTDRTVRTVALESLAAMKLLHLFRKEEARIGYFQQTLQHNQQVVYDGKRLTALLMPIYSFLSVLVLSVLLLIATYVLPGQLETWLGRLVIFLGIIFRLMGPASKLNQTDGQVSKFAPAFQAVLDFLHQEDKPFLPDGAIVFTELEHAVTLEQVNFRYEAQDATVLNDVTFTIPQGKLTALVGPSGAGKSTIVDLVARLYDCDSGRIAVDGTDVRDLTLTSWRTALAVVNQDTFLFNDTVWENLRFVKPDASDAEIKRATTLAQAHAFIRELPQGYDTLLGDRGVRLSGGQQQRIAIARAILADPQLLILDEATSELDSETERAIQHALEAFGRDRTLLVIAHRLSTVRAADNIVVLDKGRVVEQGTHETLMAANSLYWRLVQAQDLQEVQSIFDRTSVTIQPRPELGEGKGAHCTRRAARVPAGTGIVTNDQGREGTQNA